jgi:hypothetical protein
LHRNADTPWQIQPPLYCTRGTVSGTQPNENPLPVHRQAVRKRVDLTVAPEQQPCGVQVVERVGLVTSGFQFFIYLATEFAEDSI